VVDPADPDITAAGADLGPDQGDMRERRSAGRGGRRRGTPAISTISWRDIPAQLTARSGEEQHKVLLHARFQHAIDRAAAVAGLTTTHDYVQQWCTANSPLAGGDVAAQLDQRCAEIEAAYPRDRLEALVANGGLEPASGDGRAAVDPSNEPDAQQKKDTP
jgi:Virulence factor